MATPLFKCGARCYFMILVIIGLSFTSCYNLENESVEPDSSLHHGNILSPLLKALSEQNPWEGFTPRAKPDSRYVRYMKRLYKLSSKPDRSHEASHLYNTARLITPREECVEQNRGIPASDYCYLILRAWSDMFTINVYTCGCFRLTTSICVQNTLLFCPYNFWNLLNCLQYASYLYPWSTWIT